MDEFVRSIFQTAIIREDVSFRMYIELSKKAKNVQVKTIFERLAKEELLHAALFIKLIISFYVVKTDISEFLMVVVYGAFRRNATSPR